MEELLKPGRQGERAITPRPPTDGRTREETGTLREPQHEVMLQQPPRSSPTATRSPLQSSPTLHKHQLCRAEARCTASYFWTSSARIIRAFGLRASST